ncbi:MAG: tyrosine--tRNA ligase [Candidatus Margulisbacteria bacterium]|nr:tyrosine--tRNA ligase [Candidatus Margulisiibacteriota bacterium]
MLITNQNLQRGLETIHPKNLTETLLSSQKPLTIKWGADPSAPDLHLGHMVVLNKLALLQSLGHQVLFLIGDFTAMIGDPTGKSETRKPLTSEQVLENAKTYQDQVFKILDPKKTTVVFNSTWLSKLTATDIVKLTAHYTVARMLERDDFSKRFKSEQSISIHEFLYPLFQGYDSVELKSDIEIGGTDQTFNLLMGRHLQKEYGQKPQGVITVPILEGLDGVQKMSKSLHNHIAILDTPKEMFGKLMSIPDTLMPKYYDLLTTLDFSLEIHPRDAKITLAKHIVTRLHSAQDAEAAHEEFLRVFSQNQIPTDIPEVHIQDEIRLDDFLLQHKIVPSKKEAHRLIQQGAVTVEGEKEMDPFKLLTTQKNYLIKAGKRNWIHIRA